MSISAAPADIGPSPITRVAIGTVRSVRRRRATAGSPRGSASCSTCPYVHVVFTLPHALLPLGYRNATRLYTWLFQASAATLREVAADPRHLGAEIGFLSILHTWGQTLVRHPHVHCVVPAGGLSPDHQRWIRPKYAGFFLPVKVLSRVFRGKFVAALRRAYARGDLDLAGATERLRDPAQWHAFVDALFETDWVVYAKPAFGGASAVLRYLGRYTHRVAISNHRLIAFDGERVTFHWKDYAHGDQWRTMTLTAMEFLRRFVQHVLPRGFVRIRQFGYLANTCRTARLALARRLLATATRHASRRPCARPPPRLALSAVWRAHGHRPHPLGAPAGHRHPRLRHLVSAHRRRPDRRLRRRGRPRAGVGVRRSALQPTRRGVQSAHARPVRARAAAARAPTAISIDDTPTLEDPASSSIAGRRASGFLQVSLSKVPRPQHRAHRLSSLRRGTSDER